MITRDWTWCATDTDINCSFVGIIICWVVGVVLIFHFLGCPSCNINIVHELITINTEFKSTHKLCNGSITATAAIIWCLPKIIISATLNHRIGSTKTIAIFSKTVFLFLSLKPSTRMAIWVLRAFTITAFYFNSESKHTSFLWKNSTYRWEMTKIHAYIGHANISQKVMVTVISLHCVIFCKRT